MVFLIDIKVHFFITPWTKGRNLDGEEAFFISNTRPLFKASTTTLNQQV